LAEKLQKRYKSDFSESLNSAIQVKESGLRSTELKRQGQFDYARKEDRQTSTEAKTIRGVNIAAITVRIRQTGSRWNLSAGTQSAVDCDHEKR